MTSGSDRMNRRVFGRIPGTSPPTVGYAIAHHHDRQGEPAMASNPAPTQTRRPSVPVSTWLVTALGLGLVIVGILRALWERVMGTDNAVEVPQGSDPGFGTSLPDFAFGLPAAAVTILIIGGIGVAIFYRGVSQRTRR